MFDRSVREVMQRRNIVKATSGTIVSKAAKLMARKKVGAVLVVESKRLVGIFTERDVVFRVIAQDLDPQTTRLGDVMTPVPETIGPERPFGYALLVMHKRRFRHLPVVENGKILGVVSARSAMDPDLQDFVSEQQRWEHFARQK